MMRILMTTDTIGGVWTYAVDLIRALQPYNVHVHLASMGKTPTVDQRVEIETLENLTLHESDYRLEWMRDPWKDVAAAGEWLMRLRASVNPDIVHLNNYAHACLDWDLPVIVVGHSCVVSWMMSVRGCFDWSEWKQYHRAVQMGLDAADLVLAPTKWMLNQLREHYQTESLCSVIPNGTKLFKNRNLNREPFIFAAGRIWDEAKNIALLSEIADRIHWPICVAGSVDHPDGYVGETVTNLKLLGRLSRDEMQSWLGRAGLVAHPARYEPFGLCPLEAAACECPLILADIPTLRETWDGAAEFASPNDPESWVHYLNELIASHQRRRCLGKKAFETAQKYSLGNQAVKYLGAYAFALNNRRRSTAYSNA